MKVAVDISQSAYEGTGVGRYMINLARGLNEYGSSKNIYTFLFSSLRKDPPKSLKLKPPTKLIQWKFPPTVLDMMWNRLHILPFEKLVGNQDIVITSDWTEAPTMRAKKMTVIHDLVIYKYPETSTKKIIATHKRRLHWVKKESSHIIVDSFSTKKDCIDILKIPEKKLTVIYPAIEITPPTKVDQQRVVKKYKLNRPFILTVGKLEPRKNIPRLIEAFEKSNLPDVDLVIVGAKGWGKNDERKDNPHVRFLGFVSEEDLYALYATCEFFVAPALYEGFGYPVVEAMACGASVTGSNTSSLKELITGVGPTFNPLSVNSMSKTLVSMHENTDMRKKIQQKGLARAREFTVKEFVKKYEQLFQKLA